MLGVAELPGAFGGRAPHVIANALAAVAACRGLGVSAKDIRRALGTFTPGEVNPGRGNVYLAAGGPVIVDYGHNAAALDTTGRMISDVWGGEPVAAITLPGDRRDDLVAQSAGAIAAWFGRVVVYEDADKRGRRPGEMTDLITAAMRRARPGITLATAEGPQAALRTAVETAAGNPVLFLYEKLGMAHEALASLNARPWSAGPVPPASAAAVPPASAGAWPGWGHLRWRSPARPRRHRPGCGHLRWRRHGHTRPRRHRPGLNLTEGSRSSRARFHGCGRGRTHRRQPRPGRARRRSLSRARWHRSGRNLGEGSRIRPGRIGRRRPGRVVRGRASLADVRWAPHRAHP